MADLLKCEKHIGRLSGKKTMEKAWGLGKPLYLFRGG